MIREPVPGIGGGTIPAVYLVPFHRAETALAAALLRLSATPADRMPAFGTVDWGKALAWLRARTGAELAAEQEQAVRLALTQRVAVLTGGPGCGKSFTVKSVITLAAAKRAKIVLAAPTGRAAKRLTELSGHPATTVHRLLQLRPGGDPSFDRDHPARRRPDRGRRGQHARPDPGQQTHQGGPAGGAPAAGRRRGPAALGRRRGGAARRAGRRHHPPGPAHQIFRQAQQSGVVVNAHRINAGQPPVFGEHPDFFLFPADEPEATAERVVDLVARRIPRKFGIPPRDIQVLAPMHRGPAGAGTLNTLLQQALAPGREGTPERRHGARVFRPGDKVIQIRNNYDKGAAGVFNGTVGTITALSVTDQQLTVRTDEDEDIVYDFDELDELQHAYAITVHRSQGSEYPAVVVPLTMSAYTLLQRNLLYTAITRAKRLVVLVGSRKALAIAVRTAGTGRRHTALTHRLQSPGTTRP